MNLALSIAACGDNADLRCRVERLLEAYANLGSFLDLPAPEIGVTIDQAPPAQLGTQIGHYKLLERIGEGDHPPRYQAVKRNGS